MATGDILDAFPAALSTLLAPSHIACNLRRTISGLRISSYSGNIAS
jgi:hypothetical protein